VVPVLYQWIEGWSLRRAEARSAAPAPSTLEPATGD
jgi:hypothetical protein